MCVINLDGQLHRNRIVIELVESKEQGEVECLGSVNVCRKHNRGGIGKARYCQEWWSSKQEGTSPFQTCDAKIVKQDMRCML